MMTPDFDPLTRFLLIHTVLLAVGLAASAVVRRQYGPTAATLIQRMTLASVAASVALIFVSLPALNLAILPPVAETDLPRGTMDASPLRVRAQKAYPPVPVFTSLSDAEPNMAVDFPSKRFLLTFLVGVVWGVGVMVGVGTLLIGLWRLRRMERESSPVTDAPLLAVVGQMAEASGALTPDVRRYFGAVPFLAGIVRPTLYLPADNELSGDALQAALAHEMRHLVRRDLAWNLAARFLCIALWFQPLLWILWRTMERTAEEDCDEAALRRGGMPARVYADLLLRLSESPHPPLTVAAGMASFHSQIGQRIARVLEGKPMPPLTPIRRNLLLAGGIAVGLCAAAMSQVRLTAAVAQETTQETSDFFKAPYKPMPYEDAESAYTSARHKIGPDYAPIAVLEFTDFGCPSCRNAYGQVYNPVRARLAPETVKPVPGQTQVETQFAVIQRPLTEMHPAALPAAMVAELEGEGRNYWKTYDGLMSGAEPKEEDMAARLATFSANQRRVAENLIRRDMALADRFQVNSVPTYFVLDRTLKKAYRAIGYKGLQEAVLQSSVAALPTQEKQTLGPMVKMRQPVYLKADKMPLKSVLDAMFKDAGMTYRMVPGATLPNTPVTMTIDGEMFHFAAHRVLKVADPPFGMVFRQEEGAYVGVVRPLPPTGAFTGRVVYPDGSPAAGIHVGAQMLDQAGIGKDQDDSEVSNVVSGSGAMTDANGIFRIERVGAYPYNVSVSPPGAGETEHTVDTGWTAASLLNRKGVPGQTVDLGIIRMTQGGIIEGVIVDATGNPVPNLALGCHGPHKPETSAAVSVEKTNEQGRFRFRVPAGESMVYIMSPPSSKVEMARIDSTGQMQIVRKGRDISQPNILLKVAEGETERIRFQLR